MRTEQQQVRDFMLKAGQDCPNGPWLPSVTTQVLRLNLHMEEAVTELREAFESEDMVQVADSIADSLVVILGTAVACGIDIQPVFDEVMRSNMTKFIDGYRREDGKWMKGPSTELPNLAPILAAQQL